MYRAVHVIWYCCQHLQYPHPMTSCTVSHPRWLPLQCTAFLVVHPFPCLDLPHVLSGCFQLRWAAFSPCSLFGGGGGGAAAAGVGWAVFLSHVWRGCIHLRLGATLPVIPDLALSHSSQILALLAAATSPCGCLQVHGMDHHSMLPHMFGARVF